eukprot:gene9149-10734_t
MNQYLAIIAPVLLLTLILVSPSYQYGEPDAYGNPLWVERESHVLINAVRMDPKGYLNKFYSEAQATNFLNPATYPAVAPLYYSIGNNRLARAHSDDMSSHNCFNHNDCNGTLIETRFDAFLSNDCQGNTAENLAAGPATGLATNNFLLCDADALPCTADTVNDGHRENIMSPLYSSMGVGFSYTETSTYNNYWTQDFTSKSCPPQNSPIHSGSHTFINSNPVYLASWYHTVAPKSTAIYVDVGAGTNGYMFALTLGNSTAGIYTFSPLTFKECQKYVFVFKTETATYRYPDTGSFSTVISASSQCPIWQSTEILPSSFTTTGKPTTSGIPTTTSTTSSTTSSTTGNSTMGTTTTPITSSSNPTSTTGKPTTSGIPTTTSTTTSTTTGSSTTTTTTTSSTTTDKPTTTTTSPSSGASPSPSDSTTTGLSTGSMLSIASTTIYMVVIAIALSIII